MSDPRPAHVFIDGEMNGEGLHVLRCSCGKWARTGASPVVWAAWKQHVGPEGVEAWERWHHPALVARRSASLPRTPRTEEP